VPHKAKTCLVQMTTPDSYLFEELCKALKAFPGNIQVSYAVYCCISSVNRNACDQSTTTLLVLCFVKNKY